MAKFSNSAAGMRGIVLKDGTTSWVEPGQSVDLDEKDVLHVHDDLGKGEAAAKKAAAADEPAKV